MRDMGQRIGIRFSKYDGDVCLENSIVIWSHWGNIQFKKNAQKWIRKLPQGEGDCSTPFTRREVDAIALEFIRSDYGKDIDGLFPTYDDTPMPDHGFWDIDVFTGEAIEWS